MTSLSAAAAPATAHRSPVVPRLASLCHAHGLSDLSARLERLARLVHADMGVIETELGTLPRRGDVVRESAGMLVDAGGKRLRPMCVALAARLGTGFDARAKDLAVAVELVHSATLLHDDVVDIGEQRRGRPTARTVFGNASSIFAGDWLLIEALRRVQRAHLDDVFTALLDAIDEMIVAEAAQLESRGRIVADREAWLAIVDGKTAALFRWALLGGGRAGGLDSSSCECLVDYGTQLGIAFQAVDDVLDLIGDPKTTGKGSLSDLKEGRLTLPLIIAAEREPGVTGLLQELMMSPEDSAAAAEIRFAVLDAVSRADATQECVAFARRCAEKAVASLEAFHPGDVRDAFEAVALATVLRQA